MPSDLQSLLAELRRLDAEATPGPWMALRDGNQYIETRSLSSAKCVAASKIPQLQRPWNPYAVVSFMQLDAAEESRFLDADADTIATLRNALPRLIRLLEAGERMGAALDALDRYCRQDEDANPDSALLDESEAAMNEWREAAR